MNGEVDTVFALYRTCLRQIRRLPTDYLRQFFRLRVGDDVRAILDPKRQHLQPTKIRRVLKDLRKLEGANAGYVKCFDYVLNTAYGRRGPLRWEILDPLRSEPGVPPPPRIIPAVESSRPPQYSSEMTALFGSDVSRMSRPLNKAQLAHPPILPPRANPESPEALALGPFSKRREVNIRWRFFWQELPKTTFPLQTVVEESSGSGAVSPTTDPAAVARAGARSIGLQNTGVFEEVEALASPPSRLRHSAPVASRNSAATPAVPSFDSHLPTRFLRRRYQQLLARIPVLVFKPPREGPAGPQSGKFQVRLSPNAAKRQAPVHRTTAEADIAWIQYAEDVDKRKSKAK
ncbi:hypothetical protein BD413DRAFT_107783 [Trametes elegans]|nr:hypothetical protein BD413DRAFT_107783 [Trametes elegans]